MRQAAAGDRRLFQVAPEVFHRFAAVVGLFRYVNVPVRTAGLPHEAFKGAFAVDPLQLRWHLQLIPLTDQKLTQIPHPTAAHGRFVIRQILPDTVFVEATAGYRDMHVRMPVEPAAVRVDRTENANDYPALPRGIQQVVDGQAAHGFEQVAVVEKQWPQRIGQGEHQVLPGTVGQAVILGSDLLIGGLFAAGGTGTAVAGVAQAFLVRTIFVAAAVLFDAEDRGAAGEHFGDRFDFDVAQASSVEQGRPALIGGEEVFQRTGLEAGRGGHGSG